MNNTNKEKLFKLSTLAFCLAALPQAVHAAEEVQQVELKQVNVVGKNRSLRTENRNDYTTSAMSSTTGLALTPRETPQSVSVITKNQINDQGITTLADALKTTTGVNVVRQGNRTHFQSRGFYIEKLEEDGMATTIGAPGIFGSPARDGHNITDLAMYDHIEVVRGAAGLTQSNSAPGGTINAVRKKPTVKKQISMNGLADRFGKRHIELDASGTLNSENQLRGRIVGSFDHDKTFQDKVKGQNSLLYGVLEKDIGENSKVSVGAYRIAQRNTPNLNGLPLWEDGSSLPRDSYFGADWNHGRFIKNGVFAEFDHYFNDNWKWNSKIDWRNSHSDQRYAFLMADKSGLKANQSIGIEDQQAFRYQHDSKHLHIQNNLRGKFEALGQTHDIFLTHNYSKERNNLHHTRMQATGSYDPFSAVIPQPDWAAEPYSIMDSNNHFYTHALAAGTRINPTEKLHLLVGGRYTHWKRDFDYNWSRYAGAPDNDAKTYSVKNSKFIPYIGITYDFMPGQSLYASYTSIYKPTLKTNADNSYLAPEVGKNYELGWKGEWMQSKLNTAVSLFQTDNTNVGVRVNVPASGNRKQTFYYVPAKERSRGVDAEISGAIGANWKLFAGYTYNIRKTENHPNTEGDFANWTPKHIFRAYSSYTPPFANGKLSIGIGLSSQSKTGSKLPQGGYTVWNAGLQYRPTDNLQLGLAVNNLTDKRYYENNSNRTKNYGNFYGEPRNAVFSLKWKM